MQTQTIFELYTDDDKSKYSRNPKDILTSAKNIYIYIYIYIYKKKIKPPGNDGLSAEFYKLFK